MKTIEEFSAFKLNKSQMGAMKGGSVTCLVVYSDGLGGSFSITYDHPDATVGQAQEELKVQHPESYMVDCYES